MGLYCICQVKARTKLNAVPVCSDWWWQIPAISNSLTSEANIHTSKFPKAAGLPGWRPAQQSIQGLLHHPHTNFCHSVLAPATINTYCQEVGGNSHCWCPGCIYYSDKDDSSSPKTIHLTSVMSTRNFFLQCCNKEQLYNWLQRKSDHPISTHMNKGSKREAMTSIYSPNFHHHSLQLKSSSLSTYPEFRMHSKCTHNKPTKPQMAQIRKCIIKFQIGNRNVSCKV